MYLSCFVYSTLSVVFLLQIYPHTSIVSSSPLSTALVPRDDLERIDFGCFEKENMF